MKRRDLAGLVLLALLGIGGAVGLGWSFERLEEQAIVGVLQQQLQKKVRTVDQTVHLNLEALYTLKGGLEVLPTISEAPFQLLARSVLSRHRDIQALEWIPRVPVDQRSDYEARQQQAYPQFGFTELTPEGLMTWAGQRDVYFPVYFVEPLAGNEMAFGFDLGSNPARFETLERAANTGLMQASGSIRLVQDRNEQKGFLAFLPLYRGLTTTVEARERQLQGLVLGVYRIQDVFDTALSGINTDDIQLELIDRSDGGDEQLLIRPASSPLADTSLYSAEATLADIAGRTWVLRASASERFVAGNRTLLPLLALVIGLLLTLLVVGFFYTLMRHAVAVELQVAQRTEELELAKQELERLSNTDKLTGLANRHQFDEVLQQEWLRASREDQPLSLMMIDIDYFKRYNDCYGHLAGDECLSAVASMLATLFRRSADLVARYGGEEFVVILPNTGELERLAQNCCEAVQALAIPHQESDIANVVTVSIGVSTLIPAANQGMDVLIESADQALYQAKREGRNRVVGYNQAELIERFDLSAQ